MIKLNKYKLISIITILFSIPSFVFAQAYFYDFPSFVYFLISSFFNPLMYIISGLIFIYFFLGVAKYIWHAGDMEKRKEGYMMLVHGVIAIAVAMSIWGIVYFLMNSFGFYASTGTGGYAPSSGYVIPPRSNSLYAPDYYTVP